jgi:hypothetical protein
MKAEIQKTPDIGSEPERRRDLRHDSNQDSAIGQVQGVVTNVSCQGCRVLTDEPLAPDSVVWIRMGDHGPFMARVVWHDGTAAGCEFSGKLSPALVEELRVHCA